MDFFKVLIIKKNLICYIKENNNYMKNKLSKEIKKTMKMFVIYRQKLNIKAFRETTLKKAELNIQVI